MILLKIIENILLSQLFKCSRQEFYFRLAKWQAHMLHSILWYMIKKKNSMGILDRYSYWFYSTWLVLDFVIILVEKIWKSIFQYRNEILKKAFRYAMVKCLFLFIRYFLLHDLISKGLPWIYSHDGMMNVFHCNR